MGKVMIRVDEDNFLSPLFFFFLSHLLSSEPFLNSLPLFFPQVLCDCIVNISTIDRQVSPLGFTNPKHSFNGET